VRKAPANQRISESKETYRALAKTIDELFKDAEAAIQRAEEAIAKSRELRTRAIRLRYVYDRIVSGD
jgi:hypothetical protein